MKILHTGDWHLGKRLFKVSRLPEQEFFLKWLQQIILDKEIDILLIAGDIFDTPSPQAEATKLFFDFLFRVTSQTKCSIQVIAGNHDSGSFIEAPKLLLEDKNIALTGKIGGTKLFQVESEKAVFTHLPFFRAYEILGMGKELGIVAEDDDELILLTLKHLFQEATMDQDRHQILMAHHLFGNMDQIDMGGSEQVITLSGLPSIPFSTLGQYFDYLALGHIHKKHTIKHQDTAIRYPGAPMAFRFSENEKKSLTLIEIGETGLHYSEIDIPAFRQIISIRCSHEELPAKMQQLKENFSEQKLTALLEVQVEVTSPEMGIADFIREQLDGLSIELLSLKVTVKGEASSAIKEEIMTELPSLLQLFEEFYFARHPESQEIPAGLLQDFTELLSETQHQDGSEESLS